MKIALYILFPLISLLGLPFILQKLLFIPGAILGTSIGSILAGFFTLFALTWLLVLITHTNPPLAEIGIIGLMLTVNYTLFTDKSKLALIDKAYMEGAIIGYIVFLVAYYFKVKPDIWF